MGWVTLTQRKMELKHSHAQLTYRNLQIAREKRQMAREKTFETLKIQTAQKKAERKVKADFYAKKEQLEKQKDYLKAYLAQAKAIQAGQAQLKTIVVNGQNIQVLAGSSIASSNSKYVLAGSDVVGAATHDPTDTQFKTSIADDPALGADYIAYIAKPGATNVYSDDGTTKTIKCFVDENKQLVTLKDNEHAYREGASGKIIASTTDPGTGYTNVTDDTAYVQTYTFTGDPVYAEEFDPAFDTSIASLPAGVPADLTGISTSTTSDQIKAIEAAIDDAIEDIQNDLDEANLEYQEDINDTKSEFEFELNMHEQEAMDEELQLEEEQTRIETELESISAELQAIDGAASQAIQSSTIKLA